MNRSPGESFGFAASQAAIRSAALGPCWGAAEVVGADVGEGADDVVGGVDAGGGGGAPQARRASGRWAVSRRRREQGIAGGRVPYLLWRGLGVIGPVLSSPVPFPIRRTLRTQQRSPGGSFQEACVLGFRPGDAQSGGAVYTQKCVRAVFPLSAKGSGDNGSLGLQSCNAVRENLGRFRICAESWRRATAC